MHSEYQNEIISNLTMQYSWMHSIPWVNCRRSFTRDLFWYSGYKSTYTIHYIDFTLLSTVIVRLKQEFVFLLSDTQRYFWLWRFYFTILLLVLKDLPHGGSTLCVKHWISTSHEPLLPNLISSVREVMQLKIEMPKSQQRQTSNDTKSSLKFYIFN